MREPGVIVTGNALLLALGAACFAIELPGIEASIEADTTAALMGVGVRDLTVEADGRNLTLRGAVAFDEIGIEAERRAAATPGVRRVHSRLLTAVEPGFTFGHDGDIWLLTGRLPTPESRQELFDAAAAIVGQGNVIDETEVSSAVTEPPWTSTLPRLLQLLRRVDGRAGLRLQDGAVFLTGSASSAAMRDRFAQEVAAIASEVEAGWMVVDEMRVAPVAGIPAADNRVRALVQQQPLAFLDGTATLADGGADTLAAVGELLAGLVKVRTEVIVRTSATGDSPADRQLSLERADAIREILLERVPAERLLVLGRGSEAPTPTAGDDQPGAPPPVEFRVLHRP